MEFSDWYQQVREEIEKLPPGQAALAAWNAAKDQKPPKVDETFTEFWQVYPRRVAKPAAEKCWRRLSKSDKRAALQFLARAEWPEEKKFIPHPATWINQRRWEDELPDDDGPEQEFIL